MDFHTSLHMVHQSCLTCIRQKLSLSAFPWFIDMQSLGPNSVSSQGNTLKHLVLSKNKLTEVPSRAIKHLKELEHLNLNENQITALRDEAFIGLSKVRPKWVFWFTFENKTPLTYSGDPVESVSQSHFSHPTESIWWHQKVSFLQSNTCLLFSIYTQFFLS